MPQGLQIFNASGDIILNINDRVGRFLNTFTTDGNNSGTFTDSNLIGKTDFFYYMPSESTDYGGPLVTANLSTGVISWEYVMDFETSPIPSGEKVYYGAF